MLVLMLKLGMIVMFVRNLGFWGNVFLFVLFRSREGVENLGVRFSRCVFWGCGCYPIFSNRKIEKENLEMMWVGCC